MCPVTSGFSVRPAELHGIYIFADILAGAEAGFHLPAAGQESDWLAANMSRFQERARYGDADFRDLLQEMHTRNDIWKPAPAAARSPSISEEEGPPAYQKH